MDPMTLLAGGSILSGIGSIAGAFGSKKAKTPGFGLTNADEIIALLSGVGYGAGSDDFRDATKRGVTGSLQGLNYIQQLRDMLGGDMARLAEITRTAESTLPLGEAMLNELLGRTRAGTGTALAQAGATQTGALRELDSVFSGVRQTIMRDLGRALQETFTRANTDAALRGIKSTSTQTRATEQSRAIAESVGDVLASLGAQEAQLRSGVVERTGNQTLAALLQRLGAEETMGTNVINMLMGLRGGNVESLLRLLSARRELQTSPATAALGLIGSFPTYSAAPVPQRNLGDQLGQALQGIGSALGGYAGAMQSQQNYNEQMKMVREIFGLGKEK